MSIVTERVNGHADAYVGPEEQSRSDVQVESRVPPRNGTVRLRVPDSQQTIVVQIHHELPPQAMPLTRSHGWGHGWGRAGALHRWGTFS